MIPMKRHRLSKKGPQDEKYLKGGKVVQLEEKPEVGQQAPGKRAFEGGKQPKKKWRDIMLKFPVRPVGFRFDEGKTNGFRRGRPFKAPRGGPIGEDHLKEFLQKTPLQGEKISPRGVSFI